MHPDKQPDTHPDKQPDTHPDKHPDMLYRELGSTGEKVSAIGLGGFHLGAEHVDDALAVRLIRTAIDEGITFMDNCWDYNEGRSEILMGRALRGGCRDRVFLMTKIDGRSKQEAARQLDESLRRLQTDRLDLVQHHEVIRFEDPHRIFREDGANEALVEAREAGKLRYIGFTGHKDPRVHMDMLGLAAEHGFRFDAVQMPLNVLDAHYRSFERQVLPYLVEHGIGVLGMKSMADGNLLTTGLVSATECLHYALDLPTSVVITGIDSPAILDQALAAVRSFRSLGDEERAILLARTAEVAARGLFEPFKTTSLFDGTAQNLDWMGEEKEWVAQGPG
jgi:aryl-alcohol dehydrogenase-like predicted oxidoreductase